MKKLLILCILAFMAAGANAATLCAADNTIPIVLNPEINGTSASRNQASGEFSVTFPYGTIYGISTCVSTSGSIGGTKKTLVDTVSGKVVTGYEELGQYCWCQITHPVKSYWVMFYSSSSTSSCVSACSMYCYYSSSLNNFYGLKDGVSSGRKKIFSTIGK